MTCITQLHIALASCMFALPRQQHLLAPWSALCKDLKSELTLSAQGSGLLPYLPFGGSKAAERVVDYR